MELAAEIRQTTRAHAAYGLDNIDPARDIRITLLEAFSRVLPPLSDHVATAATELLAKLDVSVRTEQRVTEIDADGVHTASGDFYPSDLTVWAAGIMNGKRWRKAAVATALSLQLASPAGAFLLFGGEPASITPVIEYYNEELGEYFVTASYDEIVALDAGAAPAWSSTAHLRISC